MKLHRLFLWSLMLIALALSACSRQDSADTPPKQAVSLETIAAKARGFTVGSIMSANIAYVFFDPQCPHCARLWQASLPLHGKFKFVWIPVGLISATSLAQGAAIMTAADPQALMSEHEDLLLTGKGGISASSSIAPEIEQAIKNNTQLMTSFGIEGVPYVVAKNVKTGQMVTQDGASDTATLARLLGIDAP